MFCVVFVLSEERFQYLGDKSCQQPEYSVVISLTPGFLQHNDIFTYVNNLWEVDHLDLFLDMDPVDIGLEDILNNGLID